MPSRALTRRDPPVGKNGFSTVRGLTLIELLVVVAVVAIITTLALPSYRAIMEKRQVTSGAQQLAAFVSSAQLEAVKRNQRVLVRYEFTDVGDWCVGMVNQGNAVDPTFYDPVDGGCTCSEDIDANTCQLDDAERVFVPANLSYNEAVNGIDGSDDSFYIIDPIRGMMVDSSGILDVDGSVSFQLVSKPEQSYALRVDVAPTGRVSICSPTAANRVPGFDCCPEVEDACE